MGRCRIKQHLIMTKAEFIQRAAISMASKVIGNNGIADSGDWNNVVVEAESLANELEEQCYGFDEEGYDVVTRLSYIGDGIQEIVKALTDGEHSIQNRLGEIATDNGKEKALEAVNVSIGNMERCLDRTLQSIDKLIILMAKQQ